MIVYIVLCVIMLFLFISSYYIRRNEQIKLGMLLKMVSDNEILYGDIMGEDMKLKSMKHDLKKYSDIVGLLSEGVKPDSMTGNDICDMVITKKKKEALSYNIDFIYNVACIDSWGLETSETVSLISNILDNAIEAALRVKNDAFVRLDIWNKEATICIKVANSKLIDDQPEKNNFITTKDNAEEHGYGLKIVKKIVKEHNGIIRINDLEDIFELYIEL